MRARRHHFFLLIVPMLLLVGVVVAAAVAGPSAQRAFPGKNGRIVFNDKTGYLVLVNADGTGLVRLAGTRATDQVIGAAFSPDGKWIAYSKAGNSDPDVFVIRTDASAQRQVTFSRGTDVDPSWSGDGTRIAFETIAMPTPTSTR
jgi:Tol biopolymer transport system component